MKKSFFEDMIPHGEEEAFGYDEQSPAEEGEKEAKQDVAQQNIPQVISAKKQGNKLFIVFDKPLTANVFMGARASHILTGIKNKIAEMLGREKQVSGSTFKTQARKDLTEAEDGFENLNEAKDEVSYEDMVKEIEGTLKLKPVDTLVDMIIDSTDEKELKAMYNRMSKR